MAKQKKQVLRKAKKGEKIRQVAAIPFRIGADGALQVMLVTSRETQRFILPKGWPMKGKSGQTLKEPAGTYTYWKRLPAAFVRIDVTVYLLEVTEQMKQWPESARRQRAWLSPAQAAVLIDEPELASLVRQLKIPQETAPAKPEKAKA
jgi:hypothetical protein